MRKLACTSLVCLAIVGCDSKTDNIDLGVDQENASAVATASIGAASPAATSELPAAIIDLSDGTSYEWSVRAKSGLGDGEWSTGFEFTVHPSEDDALASTLDNSYDTDYEADLFNDAPIVPDVISVSPAGALVGDQPTFRWLPASDIDTYEVRVIDLNTNEPVYTNSFDAEDLCSESNCALESFKTEPDENWQPAFLGGEIINVEGSTTPEAAAELAAAQIETVPEVVVTPGVVDVPEVVTTPEVVVDPEVDTTPEVVALPEVDTTPEAVIEQEVDVTPEIGQALTDGDQVLAAATSGENAEIEALQQAEGLLAFPGALGYAKHTVGGRGGRVLVVNTVADVVNSGDNFLSLREALEVETGPRTIVFAVGGIFDTGLKHLQLFGEDGSNVTVACQTAPKPGVILKTYGFNVKHAAHDLIFRHCAVRSIDAGAPLAQAGRSITIRGGSRNVIWDHMSISWATDEGFQAYVDPKQTTGLENITLSNSIVSEGDADSNHPESFDHPQWGYHAMGPSCLNNNSSHRPTNCSLVNNFVAHNSSRNAMIWGGAGEISNNIVYNWYNIGLTAKPYDGSDSDAIINNNLIKSGPSTKGAGSSNPSCGPAKYRCGLALGPSDGHGEARYSVGNNYFIFRGEHIDDAELMDDVPYATTVNKPSFDPGTPSPIDIRDMAKAGSRHMNCLGASRPERDAIDARVLQEFTDGTGVMGIGENIRTGGHNVYKQRTWDIYGGPTSHPASYDQDQDGMEDDWERAYGLDPANPNDHSGDLDGDGYTNIEEFLAIAAAC